METAGEPSTAIALDYLPHGRPDDDRPQYQKDTLAHLLGTADFRLLEVTLAEDADVTIGDRLDLAGDSVGGAREIDFDALTAGARSELEYAVEAIVDADPDRFVDFYNEAQPITLRLHQLDLLPGIGEKLRNTIIDQRKREPFESFADLEDRISGLHDPRGILLDRIEEEIRADDLKYRSFARREPPAE